MPSHKKTTKPKFPLLTGNARLVAVCVAGVVLLTFMAGYLTGKMYWSGQAVPPAQETKPAKQYHSPAPARLLNPDEVRKKTSAPEKSAPDFTFPEKLSEEIKPAQPTPSMRKKVEQKKKRKQVKQKPAPVKKARAKRAPAKRIAKKTTPARSINKTLSKRLTIQVGSFKSLREARALSARLNKKHYAAYVKTFEIKGRPWHRVRVGVFGSTASARRMASKLSREQKLPTLLAPYIP